MEGRSHAAQRRLEERTFVAYQGERMAREKRPKLSTFLNDLKPKGSMSGGELMDRLRAFKRGGVPMKIKRIGQVGRPRP